MAGVELRLQPGNALRLDIRVPSDRPEVEAFVRVHPVGDELNLSFSQTRTGTPLTIEGLLPGETYRVDVSAPGYRSSTVDMPSDPAPYPLRVIDLSTE